MAKQTGVQVNATISRELKAALDDYRWNNRIDKGTEVIVEALTTFAMEHLGFDPDKADEDKAKQATPKS